MKKLLLAVPAFAIALTGCFDSDDKFFSKRKWSGFNWNEFESTEFWTDKELTEGNTIGLPKMENNIHRTKPVDIDEQKFSQQAYKYLDSKKFKLSVSKSDSKSGTCEKMLVKLKDSFGDFDSYLDRSWTKSGSGISNYEWQWKVGNSYVDLYCSNFTGREVGMVAISYSEAIEDNKIDQAIPLKCTSSFVGGEPDPRVFSLVIYPKTKSVLNGKHEYIGSISTINDSEIEFEMEVDAKTKVFSVQNINRKTGKLNGVIMSGGTPVQLIVGSCEAGEIEPEKKKF